MKKPIQILTAAVFLFLAAVPLHAQIYISSDMFQSTKLTVKASLADEKTGEPIGYASVYLVPVKDSVIAYFTLSDSAGVAKIPDVTKGGYVFNVEYMGYKPFKKEFYFKNMEENLGTVKLVPDYEFLEAAKVTEAGNPITIKQDTLEYNASSFMVSDNAMLGDLLKKMPGIEVSEKGDVKVNGKSVSKITVNGKTFFFDDKSAALNNLPAKVVDKVKVIDKDSESAQFSGISDQEKEKVMDITLKKEYEKGWFGNAKGEGGATLIDKSKDEMKDGRGFLYSGNAMVAGYNEKTQATFIGNANNVKDPNGGVMIFMDDEYDYNSDFDFGGLPSTYQAGVNVNTTAIKGLQTDMVANYLRNQKIDKRRSIKTTFISNGNDLTQNTENNISSFSNKTKGALSLKNADRKKYLLDFSADYAYTFGKSENHSKSTTSDGISELNSSVSDNLAETKNHKASGYFDFGVKDMGKKNRALTFSLDYQYDGTDQEKKEYSALSGTKSEIRNLLYDIDGKRNDFGGMLRYVEPLAENWALSIQLNGNYRSNITTKSAYNRPSMELNDYYSAYSDNKYITSSARVLAQYKKEKTNVQFGASGEAALNEIISKTYGVSTTTGKGEWYWNWSPFVQSSFFVKGWNIRARYSGSSRQPNRSRILPVLDVSDPTYISTGNIYLKPGFNNSFSLGLNKNNTETFSFFSFDIYGSYNVRNVVTASWFDNHGINYSVPVNSQKPGANVSAYLSYNLPIGKKKQFSFSLYTGPSFYHGVSYQSKGILEGIDTDNFDYTDFMASFYGDEKGSNFYSGKSGFAQSTTNRFDFYGSLSFKYKLESFETRLGYFANLKFARYSLDHNADLNTRDHSFYIDIDYVTPHSWEFKTNFGYSFYRGYKAGYDYPEYNWTIGINKDIKAVTLSLYIYDILNNTRYRHHTVNENYSQDSYGLVMGRYAMLGIKVNFGKMNQANAGRAQDASWKMMY